MKIDTGLSPAVPVDTREAAVAAEQAGYSGVWTSETKHDPFLSLGLAAVATAASPSERNGSCLVSLVHTPA